MPSFKIFGITVDGLQTKPVYANKDTLEYEVNAILRNKIIQSVVIKKTFI